VFRCFVSLWQRLSPELNCPSLGADRAARICYQRMKDMLIYKRSIEIVGLEFRGYSTGSLLAEDLSRCAEMDIHLV
jgi:hypothetical protein